MPSRHRCLQAHHAAPSTGHAPAYEPPAAAGRPVGSGAAHATDERPGHGGHPAGRQAGACSPAAPVRAQQIRPDPALSPRTVRSAPASPQPSTAQRPRNKAGLRARPSSGSTALRDCGRSPAQARGKVVPGPTDAVDGICGGCAGLCDRLPGRDVVIGLAPAGRAELGLRWQHWPSWRLRHGSSCPRHRLSRR